MVPLKPHGLCSLSLVIFFLFLSFNNLNRCTFNCSFFFLSNMLLTKKITAVHHIIKSSEFFSLVIVVFNPRISFWFLYNVFYPLTFPFCSYNLFLILSIHSFPDFVHISLSSLSILQTAVLESLFSNSTIWSSSGTFSVN